MRWAIACVAAAFAIVGAAGAARSDAIPASPTQWVTDDAAFLGDAARSQLNDRLANYNRATGHQLIVWIGDTTGDVPLEDWTIQAFTKWKVGRKGLDDGLALFVFARDHKLRIEVGYGLEEKVPDVVASRIIRETIVPLIRGGKRDEAISAGIDQIIAAISGTLPAAQTAPPVSSTAGSIAAGLLSFGFLVFWLLILFAIVRSRRRAGWGAYAIGSAFSGFWGGGGWSSGGDSGGSFGGFSGGGGMGGGGGASGSW